VSPRFACPFVLVTGGKGGVGKSTLAANLGVELARAGARVLLVDLDLGLANLDVLLKLERRAPLEDLLAGRLRIEDCIVAGPAGLDVLPAASGVPELARPDADRRAHLFGELVRASADYDLILGDTAAGIGEDVLAFAAAATRVLVVTAPDPAAVTDAYGVIKALDVWSREGDSGAGRGVGREVATPELVVNFAAGVEEARRIAERLRTTAERFLARSPRLVGWLPRSRTVLTCALAQRPFVLASPDASVTRRVQALAERLTSPTAAGISPLKPHACLDR
jgi:flagellar biosynthesis protein FlhG